MKPPKFDPANVSTSVVIGAIRGPHGSGASPRKVVGRNERLVRGGKVLFFPAPGGSVRIVGVSEAGDWIAEFACRDADFEEKYVRRMEQHVAEKTGVRIAVVG